MKLFKLVLSAFTFCSILSLYPVLAGSPCSSVSTQEPSQTTKQFRNKEVSFQIPTNFRILKLEQGLMIQSPWAYEIFMCEKNSNYPGSYSNNGLEINLMNPKQGTKFVESIFIRDSQAKETYYPGTTAKMIVAAESEGAIAYLLFIKNNKIVSIAIPMYSLSDGSGSTEVSEEYNGTVDLIMSTIQVK